MTVTVARRLHDIDNKPARVMAQKLTRGVLCGRAVLPELFPPPPSSRIVTPTATP
eukprot:COSAG01_NODE_9877_length_2314_cov_1.590068_4_plen_54_part_01